MDRTTSLTRATLAFLICSVLPLSNSFAVDPKAGDKKADEPQASVWMKRKLEYTQNILAGVATADFNQIAQNAESMRSLSKIEGFVRGRTPGYKSQLEIFQDANDEIIKQARKENVEGAALAFTQLTISCINCHKHLRDEQTKK